jgi:serine/threonine protein kinase
VTRDAWRYAEPVLTRALGLPQEAQKAAIDTAFLEDSVRRELLAILQRSSAVLSRILPEAAAGAGHPRDRSGGSALASSLLADGDSLGGERFTVIRQLGRGGMGEVYLAHDKALGTLVALKVLFERNTREAQRARICSGHPHTATLHDVFETTIAGRAFTVLVMEHLPGKPASRVVDDGPVAVRDAVRWARQVAGALAYAHDRDVLHCDLKPANVMITPDQGAKVLDFGIGRPTFEPDNTDLPLRGTLGYMAPEQLLERRFVPAGDIYSLGVTLFELVAGRPPFEGSVPELMLRIVGAPPPRLGELRSGVSDQLDAVVACALAKNPDERYRSARAFDRALEAVEWEISTHSSPVPAPMPAIPPPPWRIDAVTFAAASTATLVLLTFSGFATSMLFNSPLQRTAEFSGESAWDWPVWGLRALLAAAIVTGLVAAGLAVLRAVCRALLAAPPFRRAGAALQRAARTATDTARRAAGGGAELLLAAQVAALILFGLYFQDIFLALDSFITQRSPADVSALRPQNQSRHIWFGLALGFQLWVFGRAWLGRLREGLQSKDARAMRLAGGGLAIAVITLIVGFVIPFRILYHNESESVQYGSRRCYIVGQRGDEARLFCPTQAPPWNRVVRLDDPELQREGTVQNIFSEVQPSASTGGS